MNLNLFRKEVYILERDGAEAVFDGDGVGEGSIGEEQQCVWEVMDAKTRDQTLHR